MSALARIADSSRTSRHVCFVPRLCENSDFEVGRRIFVSVSLLWEPIAPATSLGRRQLRKQFCASLAQASFHTAWVKLGSPEVQSRGLLCPRKQTSSDQPLRSGS